MQLHWHHQQTECVLETRWCSLVSLIIYHWYGLTMESIKCTTHQIKPRKLTQPFLMALSTFSWTPLLDLYQMLLQPAFLLTMMEQTLLAVTPPILTENEKRSNQLTLVRYEYLMSSIIFTIPWYRTTSISTPKPNLHLDPCPLLCHNQLGSSTGHTPLCTQLHCHC